MKTRKALLGVAGTLFAVMLCLLISTGTVSAAAGTHSEAARKERVYVGNYNEIWAINTKTGNSGMLKRSGADAKSSFDNLQRNKNFIYYDGGEIDAGTAGIYRFDLDNNQEYRLGDGAKPYLFKNKLYYVSYTTDENGNRTSSGISRMNLNGSNQELLIPVEETNLLFTVYSGKIYYIASDNKTLCEANLQGKAKKTDTALKTKKAIYITNDSNCIYVKCNYEGGRKFYVQYNIKTKKAKPVIYSPTDFKVLYFDGNELYNYTTNQLHKYDFVNDKNTTLYEPKTVGRQFEKVLYFNDKYIVCETKYYDKKDGGWKHTLSICNRKDKKVTDVIPDI